MKQYLELNALTYDSLGEFIQSAACEEDASFLMGKAAAYIDVGFVLEQITQAEAKELLLYIKLYQGMQHTLPQLPPIAAASLCYKMELQ